MHKYPRILFFAILLLLSARAQAQSTFGAILGAVHDNTGAVVAGAQVVLTNAGTSAQRTQISDGEGNFTFSNVDVGKYSLTITAPGFEKYSLPEISLTARESRRVEATLQLGADTQTVTVTEQLENVITTEVSNLAVTKTGDELVDLPVAIYSRSAGSTSPISTLTTEAGVQTDDSGNLEVMGTTPALLSVTVDGISSVGVEYSGPVNEMFPSFNSIEEIRVSESNNNAEFSGVADITTVSKAGTNQYHGGAFENHENTVFNAGDPFTGSRPKIVMNDFGGTFGGPLTIPHIYSGKDRTFFFTSFEALRLPRQTPIVGTVPTDAMRQGDIQDYLSATYCQPPNRAPTCVKDTDPVYQPDGLTPLNETAVQVNSTAAKMLTYLFPRQNYGDPSTYSFNYRYNFPSPISSNQGDVRLDQTISARQSIFGRFSYKNRQVVGAPDTTCGLVFCQSGGGVLQGAYNLPEIDEGMTIAHNFIFSPTLLNEFRGGYNAQHT